ncbi:MAG TPA: DUF2231 domain-containing protein [Nocardioides sp.]|nr:DUF2231 domain-containing protein [Nocardioides sp.]
MRAATTQVPTLVRLTQRLEESDGLDGAVAGLQPVADKLRAHPRVDAALRGEWLGHAVHPLMTDAPIGMWTSAMVLDAVGGEQSQAAARRLVGLGVLMALPTAWTGWAEWAVTGQREQRVGVVHAVANGVALLSYTASYRARRRGDHKRGKRLALLGGGALGVGGYLGAHLIEVRKVSSRHPAYGED